MQYIIIARDHTDSQALKRRLAARPDHIAMGDDMQKMGTALFGAVMLNEQEQMHGSVYIVDFATRADLDKWLSEEPYVKGNVWDKIEVTPCAVGPSFLNK